MLVFMQMQNNLVWRKQLLCSLRVKWANNYRRWPSLESVYNFSTGQCQRHKMSCLLHKYNTTLPFWSELRAGRTYKWLPCYHRSTHTHTETKPNKTNYNQATQIKRHVHTSTHENTNMTSESAARLGRHLLGDTLLFAGQGCGVSELRYHSHRGQRRPSCGVHSALETTSGFVCLEMRMRGGSETPSTQNQAQDLTFTGVYAVFLSSIHIHFLSFQSGMG